MATATARLPKTSKKAREAIQRRLAAISEVTWSGKADSKKAAFGPNETATRIFGFETLNEARKMLTMAGMTGWKLAEQFLYIQVASTIIVTFIGVVMTSDYTPVYAAVFMGLAVWIGYKGPVIFVKRKIGERKRLIELDLSFFIEILASLRETGLAFEQCLRYLGQRGLWKRRPLFAEVEVLRSDLDRGKPRELALQDFGDRTGVESVRGVAAALSQGERHGTELKDVLRDVAKSINSQRERDADAESRRAPVKLMLPIILFIFPTVMIMLMGPIILRAAVIMGAMQDPLKQ